jgi:hypothetical protein
MERFRRFGVIAFLLFIATPGMVRAGYLDENPDEVFSSVYERLGPLPVTGARSLCLAASSRIKARAVRSKEHRARSRPRRSRHDPHCGHPATSWKAFCIILRHHPLRGISLLARGWCFSGEPHANKSGRM